MSPSEMMDTELFSGKPAGVQFWEYVYITRKRWWIVVSMMVIFFGIGWYLTSGIKPVYTATGRLMIASEHPVEETTGRDFVGWGESDELYLNTQMKLIESPKLAETVIRELKLYEHPEFVGQPVEPPKPILERLENWVRRRRGLEEVHKPAHESSPKPVQVKPEWLVGAFLSRLTVERVKNSRLVDVSFVARDPELAAKVVNCLIDNFMKDDLRRRVKASEDALSWLREQQQQLKANLEKSEAALQEYMRQTNEISFEDRLNIIQDKLVALNRAATEATTRRMQAEALYNQINTLVKNGGSLDSFPDIEKNEVIRELKRQRALLQTELLAKSERFGPKYQDIIILNQQLEYVQKQLDAEMKKVLASVEAAYLAAKRDEESLLKRVEEQKKEALALNEKAIQYKTLKRDVESNQQLLDLLARVANEAKLSANVKQSTIQVVSEAPVPTTPTQVGRTRNIGLAVMLGLGLGIVLVIFLEGIDTSIRTAEDVTRYLEVPVLGLVARHEHKGPRDRFRVFVMDAPHSLVAECFRKIRASLQASYDVGGSRKSLMITSAVFGEGKTTVAACLAVIFAQSGKRVLLVDGDMRRPAVHKLLKLNNEKGLSNYLTNGGGAAIQDLVIPTDIPNLTVLPCGPRPRGQYSELLGSERMKDLIRRAVAVYDLVIVDSPPLMSVADPLVLAPLFDGIIKVVRVGHTPRMVARESLTSLQDVKANVLGVVLNHMDTDSDRYSKYYYRYYRYYQQETEREHGRPTASAPTTAVADDEVSVEAEEEKENT